MKSLEIIICTRRRPADLELHLNSLLVAATRLLESKPPINARLTLAVCGPDANAYSVVEKGGIADLLPTFVRQYEGVISPALARNQIVSGSSADWLLFCDDDTVLHPDFLCDFGRILDQNPKAAAIGGPNLGFDFKNAFQVAQEAFLGSKVFNPVFNGRYRPLEQHTTHSNRSLCLCNLFVKRDLLIDFQKPGFDFFPGEENILLTHIAKQNPHFIYSPQLFAHHRRRPSLRQFANQMERYGHGRANLMILGFVHPGLGLITTALAPFLMTALAIVALVVGPALLMARGHLLRLEKRLPDPRPAFASVLAVAWMASFFYLFGVFKRLATATITQQQIPVVGHIDRRLRFLPQN